jgi:hypothetical protein
MNGKVWADRASVRSSWIPFCGLPERTRRGATIVRDQTSAIHELFVSVLRSNLDLGQRQHAPVADRERAVEHVAEFGFRVDTQCVEDRGVDVGRRAWL